MSIGARKRGRPCGACGLMVEECAISIRNLTVRFTGGDCTGGDCKPFNIYYCAQCVKHILARLYNVQA